MTRTEIELLLAVAIDQESVVEPRWWPGKEMAPIAYRRLVSFDRRHKVAEPTAEQRSADLAKGLQAHFEPDIPYTPKSEWLHLSQQIVTAFIQVNA